MEAEVSLIEKSARYTIFSTDKMIASLHAPADKRSWRTHQLYQALNSAGLNVEHVKNVSVNAGFKWYYPF